MILARATIDTPLGAMLALASDRGLVALEFDALERQARLNRRLAKFLPGHAIEDHDAPVFEQTRAWLGRYFAGESAEPNGLPLDQHGEVFERTVWTALVEIAAGATDSYGGIAAKIGSPGAARAVGLANGANPIAMIVPCHRVIGSNGTLTGYGGGLDRKRWLLNHEARWRRDDLFART